jgi:hypothetical protein
METYVVTRTSGYQDELYHHGTKGQKWGQRLYQNKDGSLTPLGKMRYGSGTDNSGSGSKPKKVSRKVRKQRAAALEKARKAKAEKLQQEKTIEEKRAHLLKSADAKELYENRHLLTTAELNDRINRIDVEAKLSSKIVVESKKTGMDFVNSKMNTTTTTITNAKNLYKSIDDAYSAVTTSAIGKMVAKKMGVEPPKKNITLDNVLANITTYSNSEVQEYARRFKAEKDLLNEQSRRKKNNP